MHSRIKRWASRSATLRGFAYLFFPNTLPDRKPAPRKSAAQIDDEAIAADWMAIGDDLRTAMDAERRHMATHHPKQYRELVHQRA